MSNSAIIKRMGNISFTEGRIWDKLLRFVLPIAAASIIQQLFYSADTVVVGRFVGRKEALAAVGGTTALINLFIEFFIGLSNAANVIVARFIGQGDKNKASDAVHTAISVALISGGIVGIAGLLFSRPMLRLMLVPEDIIGLSVEYLQIYFVGMPFLMLSNFSSAIE